MTGKLLLLCAALVLSAALLAPAGAAAQDTARVKKAVKTEPAGKVLVPAKGLEKAARGAKDTTVARQEQEKDGDALYGGRHGQRGKTEEPKQQKPRSNKPKG